MYITIQISNSPHIKISCSTLNTIVHIYIHPKRTNNKHVNYK